VKDKIRQRTIEAYKLETILMKKIIALAVAAVVAAPAMADLTISGSARYQVASGTYTPAVAAPTAAAVAAANAAATDICDAGGIVEGPCGVPAYVAGNPVPASTAGFGAETNRVLMTIAGSSTAESGMFVSASATIQMVGAAADTGRDGDTAVTIGNSAANVVLGAFEPAGAFNSGSDAFQNSALADVEGGEGSLSRDRSMQNIGLNVTAVEGLTFQVSTDVDTQDVVRVVAGYDFGAATVTVGHDSDKNGDDLTSITAGTTLGGAAVNVSYGKQGDASSLNVNGSYMGFSLAVQRDDTGAADEQEVYGSYALANPAGLEGLTVTVGAGGSDFNGVDTRYGVRLDYAF
jgi:hypothetical protein